MQARNQEIHLLDYWRIINSRRHILISFFIAVVGIVTVYSFVATPHYQGTVKLLVNQDTNTTLTFGEGGSPQIQIKDPTEYYNTQKKLLFSRDFVDRVIVKYDLDKHPYFVEKKKKSNDGFIASAKSFLVNLFANKSKPSYGAAVNQGRVERDPWLTTLILEHMKVDVGRDSNIMEIHYDADDDPGMAAAIANDIALVYIEYNLDLRITPYKNSVEWLSSRLSELKNKVEASEKSLQKYKEEKGIIAHESKESILTQKLQGLVSELVRVQGERQEAEVKYRQIREVVDKPELLATVPDIMNNLVIQNLRTEELNLRSQVSDLSEKYGPKHPKLIKAKAELGMLRRSIISEARKMLNAAKTAYEIALNREKFLNKSIDEEKQEVLVLGREMIDLKVVSEESDNNKRFYEMLLKKLQEATLLSGVTVSNIQIIDSALPPSSPIKPNRLKNILLAVVVGLLGGVFLTLFVDYMDDSLKNQEDVENHLGQPFLGIVPFVPDAKMLLDATAPVHESYMTIRMGLKFSSSERPLKTVLITSSIPSEGKTTTASNLANVLAQAGERVLLIDADLRRPSIHKYFDVDNSIGIGSVIAEHGDVFPAIRQLKSIPNLSILSAGPMFPNPTEVLSSDHMKELLTALRGKYDRIVIDAPPIMPVSDPLILAGLSDGVIIIARGGVTSRGITLKSCQSLIRMKVPIIGIVLNNVKIPKRGYGNYYYSYYHPYSSTGKNTT